jgi:RNA polymerase sigma factor (sigma-70 family)
LVLIENRRTSDNELICSFWNGNTRAFDLLVQRHRAILLATLARVVKDADDVHDLYQDTVLKIYHLLSDRKYSEEGRFKQWAVRIAKNMAIDYYRKAKRKPITTHLPADSTMDYLWKHSDHEEARLIQSEEAHQVNQWVDQLPPLQREVLIMRQYMDMSFKEIAQETDVSINTALGRMRYALLNLKKMAQQGPYLA